jgi:hypothetical protein
MGAVIPTTVSSFHDATADDDVRFCGSWVGANATLGTTETTITPTHGVGFEIKPVYIIIVHHREQVQIG